MQNLPAEAYPLQWPEGWARTSPGERKEGLYKVSFAHARANLFDAIRKLGGTSIVVSSNLPIKRNGMPYSSPRDPEDPAVAVYWARDVGGVLRSEVMACDKWRKPRDNLRAVGLAIEALRQLQRTGATDLLERAFAGFAALSAQNPTERSCWEILGWPARTAAGVRAAYLERALVWHPDRGGSTEAMQELNAAYSRAKKELERGP